MHLELTRHRSASSKNQIAEVNRSIARAPMQGASAGRSTLSHPRPSRETKSAKLAEAEMPIRRSSTAEHHTDQSAKLAAMTAATPPKKWFPQTGSPARSPRSKAEECPAASLAPDTRSTRDCSARGSLQTTAQPAVQLTKQQRQEALKRLCQRDPGVASGIQPSPLGRLR